MKNELAFPAPPGSGLGHMGMTLRDYMAVHLGQGYVAALAELGHHPSSYTDEVAKEAYRLADAMLKERENPND